MFFARFLGRTSLGPLCAVATWLAVAAPQVLAGPNKPIYAWIDATGALHATDKLAAVPEPYYSSYRLQLAEAERAARAAGSAAKTSPAPQPAEERELSTKGSYAGAAVAESEARGAWKARMAAARTALLAATVALAAAEAHLAEVGHNPLLNFTPVTRARVELAQARVEAARKEALAARQELLVGLPGRARDEHVPPQWLLP